MFQRLGHIFVLAAFLPCRGILGADALLPVAAWEGKTMGCTYTVKIVAPELPDAKINRIKSGIEERLKEINRQMSHYQPDSELSRFNTAPANLPFKVSREFAQVMRFALEVSLRSEGAFDPTIAPVINLWGFGEKSQNRVVPDETRLREALRQTGWRRLQVTANDELVKTIPELTINLSGIAKGYGVDEMARVATSEGFTNVYCSIAGEVLALGHNPRGTKWQIGIAAPVAHWRENDPMAAAVALSNQSLSTSGDYQQFFTDAQGRRLSHIIDPKTGWPVQHSLGGVSVVADNCMTADALATTLFVLGPERGLKFIEKQPNAAALFITRDSQGNFEITPSSMFTSLTSWKP